MEPLLSAALVAGGAEIGPPRRKKGKGKGGKGPVVLEEERPPPTPSANPKKARRQANKEARLSGTAVAPLSRKEKRAAKSRQRKEAKVAEEKAKTAKRAALMASLAKHAIPAEHLAVMRGSASLGKGQTKRQRATLESATKAVLEAQAHKKRRGKTAVVVPDSSSSSSSSSGSDIDSEFEEVEAAAPPRRIFPTPDGLPPSSGSDNDDDELEPEPAPAAALAAAAAPPTAPNPPAPAPAPFKAIKRPAPMADAFAKKPVKPTAAETAELLSKPEEDRYVPVPLKGVSDIGQEAPAEMRARIAAFRRTRYTVAVHRKPDVEASRMELPVCKAEQEVMELIYNNDIVILCGETGSGKTTQVPQFLYEAGFGSHRRTPGMIAVTQPRRVAAIAMAKRVSAELNAKGVVAHQVRYDTSVSAATRVKFMTDGILLREIQADLLLTKYSVIIIDEAHERGLNCDVLIGLLSRALPLRNQMAKDAAAKAPKGALPTVLPLKLIIMSATLRVEDFTSNRRLFPTPPPVFNVKARQYPVTKHFAKRTELEDYVGAAVKKVMAIHERLPPGGILVFLTGEQEIKDVVRRLTKKFEARRSVRRGPDARLLAEQDAGDVSGELPSEDEGEGEGKVEEEGGEEDPDSDMYDDDSDTDTDSDSDSGWEGVEAVVPAPTPPPPAPIDDDLLPPVKVLPLYAMLPQAKQAEVFKPPPEGHRLVVVSTNVAETSVTLPGIRYVVDCGRVKRKVYNPRSGASAFVVDWISKAAAEQRAGRAGRVGPGHTYRLYSSAVFSRFVDFDDAEVVRMPLDSMIIQLKAMNIMSVMQFPFPTPPPRTALDTALRSLVCLGALQRVRAAAGAGSGDGVEERLTPLGAALPAFPVSPPFAKMLLMGQAQLGAHPHRMAFVVAAVAAMSAQSPFLRPSFRKPAAVQTKAPEGVEGEEGKGEEEGGGEEDVEVVDEEEDVEDAEALAQAREDLKRAKAAHKAWKDPTSDTLTLLAAVGDYSFHAGSKHDFCTTNFLHAKTLMEITKLRAQLHAAVTSTADFGAMALDEPEAQAQAHAAAAAASTTPFVPELEAVSDTNGDRRWLREVVAAASLDRVARMVPPEEDPEADVGSRSRGTRRVAYVSASRHMKEYLYIHPGSSVFSRERAELPQFVAFQEVVISAKGTPYMKGVTAVDPKRLPLLADGTPLVRFGEVLETPLPHYNAAKDCIMGAVKPLFGDHDWELPPFHIPHPDATQRFRWFARSLLEGAVFPAFKRLEYKESTTVLTRRSHTKLVQRLVGALAKEGIDTKAGLKAKWASRPQFLKAEVLLWVRDADPVAAVWEKACRF